MILIDSWPYDLMVSGEISVQNDITDFPVEGGGTIADHMISRPLTFSCEGIVSDTPIGEVADDSSRQADEVSTAVFGADQIPLPSAEAYERLMAIRDEKRLVTVEIPIASRSARPGKRTLVNMGIEQLTVPMSKETSGGLHFSVGFKRITIATNNRTTVKLITATPAGRGRKIYNGPGRHILIDNRVMWRLSVVYPGGPLITPDGYPYTIVGVAKQSSGPPKYYFLGESANGFPYDTTSGKELTPAQFDQFAEDQQRDYRAVKKQQLDAMSPSQQVDELNARRTDRFRSLGFHPSSPPGVTNSAFPATHPDIAPVASYKAR